MLSKDTLHNLHCTACIIIWDFIFKFSNNTKTWHILDIIPWLMKELWIFWHRKSLQNFLQTKDNLLSTNISSTPKDQKEILYKFSPSIIILNEAFIFIMSQFGIPSTFLRIICMAASEAPILRFRRSFRPVSLFMANRIATNYLLIIVIFKHLHFNHGIVKPWQCNLSEENVCCIAVSETHHHIVFPLQE